MNRRVRTALFALLALAAAAFVFAWISKARHNVPYGGF